ncbi:DUF2207 domain-containing protein [Pseudohoeflea suaedae]|nr:DUF2207 domain-containing protein [Pseudohoeflea suaedae]
MAVLFLVGSILPVTAQDAGGHTGELIRNYHADILVQQSGTLDVTETITVMAEGDRIRRGIFRDIPLKTFTYGGLWEKNGFKLLAVERDGQPETYRTEWNGRFLRIYLGRESVLLRPGVHTYTIRYETTRQLRYFDDYDEVYWNVTGNFWAFPILRASATVYLPDGAVARQAKAYTGAYGTEGADYTGGATGGAEVRFEATRPLDVEEGLTVAVGFTKGVVALQEQTAGSIFSANIGYVILFVAGILLPLYYLFAWFRVGRDPPGPPVIPLFHPPEDMEPAAVSYAHFNGFKSSGTKDFSFIAALLSLGVKKRLVIDDPDYGSVRFRRGKATVQGGLPHGERALYDKLLGSRESIELNKANGKTLLSARSAFQSAIRSRHSGKFYRLNMGWFILGLVVFIPLLILGLATQSPPDAASTYLVPALITAIFGSIAFYIGLGMWTDGIGGNFRHSVAGLLMAIGCLVLAAGLSVMIFADGIFWYRVLGVLLMFNVAFAALMVRLLGAPTKKGVDVLNGIEGFKLYLTTAETNRLNMRDAPELSEELFERYLPYAAGLGVEEPWTDAWAAQMRRMSPAQASAYRPGWYRGRSSWSTEGLGRATAASVAAVSSAMASAMPAPKSSSGSSGGGGGFSGGGGGGGGGGGW